MTNLAAEVATIRTQSRPSPLTGYEHIRGWGIYALPFDSGHALAVHVFPESDFAPYRAVWHRTPTDEWAIYYDAPRADAASPRYYGAAADHVAPATISVRWTDSMDLEVEMDEPSFGLSATMAEPPAFAVVNAVGSRIPERVLRTQSGLQTMEWVADAVLALGDVSLSGVTPNGQRVILLPRQLFPIVNASARLDDQDLGRPAPAERGLTLNGLRFPRRPVFAIGRAYYRIQDYDEYRRTLLELRDEYSREV